MGEKAAAIRYGILEKFKVWFFYSPVLIYTMGKVGSSSIAISLRERDIVEVQPHSLNWVRRGSYFVAAELPVFLELFYFIKTVLIKFKTFCYKTVNLVLCRKIKIVSIYRDPLARNVSAFFEQHPYVVNGDINTLSSKQLIDIFWRCARHDTPLIWFECELAKTFDVDILDYPFDKQQGFSILRKGNVDILLLTMEKMNENEAVIGEFLNLSEFHLASTNRAEKKGYIGAYNAFKSELVVPAEYAQKLYTSPVCRHFYTEEQIQMFREQWNII